MKRDADHIPFVEAGSYPIRPGNSVLPLVDGELAFRRICEAIEAAGRSVFITVAFMDQGFELPDGRGSLFDLLDRAHARGLDVRIIFWRHPEPASFQPGTHFAGTGDERRMLEERGTRVAMRWDQAHGPYCQHQKSWIIDAGEPGETSFVGGINLNNRSVAAKGHPPREVGNTHDVYVEVKGPAATDVHHNFVQRWNEASERGRADGRWPDTSHQDDLPFPDATSPEAGHVPVQIQRTIGRDRYANAHPAVGHRAFEIADGEHSIVDQYRCALEAARGTIYVEHQAIRSKEIVERLRGALERGVDVVLLVPIGADTDRATARRPDETKDFLESLAALGDYDQFLLAGLAANEPGGGFQNVYVHAKIALIDDAWCTIGSANFHDRSLYGHSELNASFWCAATVRALRVELLAEHLGRDTSKITDREAMRLYREIARANSPRWQSGTPLDGLAIALDPAMYPTS